MLLTKKQIKEELMNNRTHGKTSTNIRKIVNHMMDYHSPQPQVFEESKFCIYTSGKPGNYYLQSAVNIAEGQINSLIVLEMCRKIVRDYNDLHNVVISGGESRDWIISYPVAAFLGVPHLSIYKYEKGKQEASKTIGADEKDIKGKTIIHVADLNNQGSSVRDMWAPKIESMGNKIDKIYFIIDRCEEGQEVIKNMGIASESLINMNPGLWSYLHECKYISLKQLKSIEERLHNEHKWSLRVLKQNPKRIVELNKSQPERVQKMMSVYAEHPELFECIKN